MRKISQGVVQCVLSPVEHAHYQESVFRIMWNTYLVNVVVQFEEMYEQKRKEVNKAAEKFEKQLKAAKRSGSKANQDKVQSCSNCSLLPCALCCFFHPVLQHTP